MIYCSNLCTEIAQNMAPIEHISTEVHTENGDTVVVTATRPGEFVVCNLASLSLGNLPVEDEAYMERTVETAISHKMDEIFEICDEISVLRDGSLVMTKPSKETDMNELIAAMVGRSDRKSVV